MTEDRQATLRAAEDWLEDHGLPWFVAETEAEVRGRLSTGHLVRVALAAVLLATAAGIAVSWWLEDPALGLVAGETVLGLFVAVWTVRALHGWAVLTWAGRRTKRSLWLLFALATRALPLLLLFMTFLFINTEVWQVASSLHGGVMWQAVLLFALIGVGFLLARLPEELDEYDEELTAHEVVAACRRTPLERAAVDLRIDEDHVDRHSDVVGLERGNLVLVLLIAQAIQVFLLALAVWLFFLVFGAVAMKDAVIKSWIGEAPHELWFGVTRELVQVSTFLAAFAGLYFTVYAVTDGTYRQQFFTSVRRELERAVSVRLVYRALLDSRR